MRGVPLSKINPSLLVKPWREPFSEAEEAQHERDLDFQEEFGLADLEPAWDDVYGEAA